MPPKPNLVFNTAPTAFETDHDAFNVQLSPIKPEQDLSHTTIPSAPIIEDWVSDSEKESETKAPLFVPSFAQSFEHVKSPRDTVQPIETTIRAATPTPNGPTPHPQRTDPAPEGGVVPPPRNKRDEEFTEEDNRNELADIQFI
nr:hypothetical protein [Tanacetum cinerariifolium]